MNPVTVLKNSVVVRIVAAIVALVVLLSAGYIGSEIGNAKTAAKQAISAYGMRMAESYAGKFDARPYEQFLQHPEQNELYWSIREQLDRYRTQIGALYVYLVRFDAEGKPLIMIDGQPKDSAVASPIGEVTDMPAAAVAAVQDGRTADTPLLDNPTYGTYISTFAPIKNASGAIIGAIGIDTDARVVAGIAGSVIRGSIPYYLLLLAGTAAAVALIVFLIVRSLRPLRVIQAGAERIAAGDLAQAGELLSRQPVRSNDEIGATYRAMVRMSGNLHAIVSAMAVGIVDTSAQVMSSADRFRGDADRLLEWNQSVTEAMQEMAEGAQNQRLGAAESARSIEEITLGIQRVSEAAATVSDAAKQALHEAENGQETMRRMERQMKAISSAGTEVLEMVTALRGYSEQIGGALGAIAEIAGQTKLLALNASIEAARAGEHGRGFAVVAAEVRQLAESAAASTDGIGALLHNIRRQADGIAGKMNEGVREMQQGVAVSAHAEAAFRRVLDTFRHVNGQIQEVSAASEQMSAGSEEAAAAVTGIADIATASADRIDTIYGMTMRQLEAARNIAESAERVSAVTQQMRQSVEQLKL